MSYYDNGSWSPAGRQGPWDPSSPVSRQGNTPTGSADDGHAFYYQFASMHSHFLLKRLGKADKDISGVDRAVETWRKGSKLPNGEIITSRTLYGATN
jgi:hypothetical protein